MQKPLIDFNKNKSKKDGLQESCRDCRRKHTARYYQDNKEKQLKSITLRKQRLAISNRSFQIDYLKSHPCVDCGESDPIVLEFDHVHGTKIRAISAMINIGYSLDAIRNEIAKCEVRCSNCHKRRTAKVQNWLKAK